MLGVVGQQCCVRLNVHLALVSICIETPFQKCEKNLDKSLLTQNKCLFAYLNHNDSASEIAYYLVQQRAQCITPLTCSGWFVFYRTHKFQVDTCIQFPGAQEDQLFSPTCHTQDVHRGVWQTHSCWCGPVDNGIKRLLVEGPHILN